MKYRRKKLPQRERDLVRRYLIWCYKTTKEELDRTDRYFTQRLVDEFIFKSLRALPLREESRQRCDYQERLNEFARNMQEKTANAAKKKFADPECTRLDGAYLYLRDRLNAIEEAITHFLGPKEGDRIRQLYEAERTTRILAARDH